MKRGFNMSVVTRIDSRSENNSSIQLLDANGNILAIVKALSPSCHCEITSRSDIKVVKENGAVLKRKG